MEIAEVDREMLKDRMLDNQSKDHRHRKPKKKEVIHDKTGSYNTQDTTDLQESTMHLPWYSFAE
jgi:hypothetical protein